MNKRRPPSDCRQCVRGAPGGPQPATWAGEREAMEQPTEKEWERLRTNYRTSSAIRTELAYLRRQWPKLETEEQRRHNLQDRAILSQLLLTVDR